SFDKLFQGGLCAQWEGGGQRPIQWDAVFGMAPRSVAARWLPVPPVDAAGPPPLGTHADISATGHSGGRTPRLPPCSSPAGVGRPGVGEIAARYGQRAIGV